MNKQAAIKATIYLFSALLVIALFIAFIVLMITHAPQMLGVLGVILFIWSIWYCIYYEIANPSPWV